MKRVIGRGGIVPGVAAAVVLGFSSPTAATSHEWKDFYEIEGPVTVLSEGLLSRYRIGGPVLVEGLVSPDLSTTAVLAYGDVFVKVGNWSQWWEVSGLDGRSGRPLWNFHTRFDEDERSWVESGALGVDGKTVYVAGHKGQNAALVAFDARTGEIVWERSEHNGFFSDMELSPDGSRIYGSGRILGQTESPAMAMEAETGTTIWTTPQPNDKWWVAWRSTLSPNGERLFFNATGYPDADGYLLALNTADGSRAWSVPRTEFFYRTPLLANNESVFLAGTGSWGEEEQHLKLAAYDAATGEERWILSATPEEALRSSFADFALSLDGSVVYLAGTHFIPNGVFGSPVHALHAFDAASGQELWAFHKEYESRSGWAGPIAVDVTTGEVISTDFDSTKSTLRIKAHDPATGGVNWTVKRTNSLAGAFDVKSVPGGIAVFAGHVNEGYGAYGPILLKPRFPRNFPEWQEWYFPADAQEDPTHAEPQGDPGGFGVPNFLRYALALDAHRPERDKLPSARTVAVGINGEVERYLGLSFTQRPDTEDLKYIPEVSGDMKEWIRVPEANIMRREEDADGTETVTIADWVPMGDEETDRRFMRLRVERVEKQ